MIVYIKYWYLFIILNKSELILNDNYYKYDLFRNNN